ETSWIPVCATRWSYNNSRVLCRSMGYDSKSVILSKLIRHNPVYLKTDIRCNGTEHHLKDCINYIWEKASGTYQDRRLVDCSQIVLSCDMRQLRVRLESEGCYTGLPAFDFYNEDRIAHIVQCRNCRVCIPKWRKWGIQEAKTICKVLGYPPQYTSIRVLHFNTKHTEDKFIQGFKCEDMFDGGTVCHLVASGCYYKWNWRHTAVYCHNGPAEALPSNFTAKPELLSKGYGQIEIHYNNKRGAVCAHGWGINETKVACRGYTPTNSTKRYIMTDDQTNNFAHFGARHNLNDVIVMSDVKCNGDEQHLSE
ncbi:unnamed protein product, partial [Owenia fusiformis]